MYTVFAASALLGSWDVSKKAYPPFLFPSVWSFLGPPIQCASAPLDGSHLKAERLTLVHEHKSTVGLTLKSQLAKDWGVWRASLTIAGYKKLSLR